MKSIAQNKRYLQHEVTTKLYAVRLYRQAGDVQFVCRRYHISKASLMRWNKQYDGTRESLEPKSHRPKTPHPNAHTEEELTWIRNLHRRNPNISVCEMYGKLREEKAYSRHPGSLYRVFVRLGYRRKAESTKKKSKHLGKYDTPTKLGVKWQMDVKYVPKICYAGKDGETFFQYTMIEEASRKRFIYAYKEQSSFSTVDFMKRAITFSAMRRRSCRLTTAASFTIPRRRSAYTRWICFARKTASRTKRSARARRGTTAKSSAATETIMNDSITT